MGEFSSLSDEQLVINAQEGCKASFAEVVQRYLPKVKSVVSESELVEHRDDLFGSLNLALVKAVKSFDISKSIPFKAFIVTVLNHASKAFHKRRYAISQQQSLSEPDETTLDDSLSPHEEACKSIDNSKLHAALDSLSQLDANIMKGLYFYEIPKNQLANRLSISYSTLERHRNTAQSQLGIKLKKLHLNCDDRSINANKNVGMGMLCSANSSPITMHH